ncbi:MAG TPA: helix-turn-helix transcriptional regulator [Blastocatellia bacterium]
MGKSRRQRPVRLGAKLKEARLKLALTQIKVAERLRVVRPTIQGGHVAEYEGGRREPSLIVLLEYARMAGIPVDFFLDDELDLPAKLPARMRKGWDKA